MIALDKVERGALDPFVELTSISKSFGRVYALEGINLKLYPGEIVSLVGDNGAGKSTLTKIISGIERPDPGGRITIDGREPKGWSASKARNLGIETVHQSRALSEQQTIYNNVFMGRERTNALGFVKRKEEIAETEALLRRIGYTSKVWTPKSTVNKLSGGERQGVAIARAILFNSRLVLLDEPTTAMALSEVAEVMEFIVDLKDCPAMDSTFMGTLAGIASRIREAGGGDLWVVNRNERNTELLAGLGIDAMFSDKPLPAAPNGVKAEPLEHNADKAATRETMHEAHAICIAVNPENAEKFKDVMETLKASAAKAGKS